VLQEFVWIPRCRLSRPEQGIAATYKHSTGPARGPSTCRLAVMFFLYSRQDLGHVSTAGGKFTLPGLLFNRQRFQDRVFEDCSTSTAVLLLILVHTGISVSISINISSSSRSQWPCGLRSGSVAARFLGLRVRIPRVAWTPFF
jgi:hypothetical protein